MMSIAKPMATKLLIMGLLIGALTASGQEPPHIIVILTDDMGFSDIGAVGGDIIPTPRLDGFAAEGTKFTQYYSASPICSPSRTSVLTGMFSAGWNFTKIGR